MPCTQQGLNGGQSGPALPDLQIITGTPDVDMASFFLTAACVGHMTGAILCGIIFTRINPNAILFIASFLMGVATIAVPYCDSYGSMICIRIAYGFFLGIVDTGGHAEHMRLWGTEGSVLMQVIHFMAAVGSLVSPLYTEPFLAPKSDKKRTNSAVSHRNLTEGTTDTHLVLDNLNNGSGEILNQSHYLDITRTSFIVTTEDSYKLEHLALQNGTSGILLDTQMNQMNSSTNVHYAYMITGIFILIISLPFLLFCVQSRRQKEDDVQEKKKENATEKVTQRDLPRAVVWLLLFSLCSFYFVYCCIEDTFAVLLMTFLVEEFDFVTKSQGAYATAVFFGSFVVSRFLLIFISNILSPKTLLAFCCVLSSITLGLFTVSASFGVLTAMFVFIACAGLGMSAVFPAGFSWSHSEILRVTGFVSSCILIASSSGAMVNPLIVSKLMKEVDTMWFCYLLLCQSIFLICIFIFLLAVNRYVNHRYGKMEADTFQEIDSGTCQNKTELQEPFICSQSNVNCNSKAIHV
ncbi:sodium-dependent glucose transporter 1B [Aplysia californica]|uniref:Sodium-dependent glucose transporter 1B n=1 Tax=Aplysia californica TaxID=6500 RepID=A0ABM0JPP0_APLCA|nr:sodium-dependent glucose transporter 1B [Aplysia californica]